MNTRKKIGIGLAVVSVVSISALALVEYRDGVRQSHARADAQNRRDAEFENRRREAERKYDAVLGSYSESD